MTKYPIEEYLNTELPRLRSVGMSASAKERIKAELSAYAEMHAVRPMPVRSPITFFPASFWRISGALATLLLVVGGSAYASTDALPGSALYPVKVSVAEPFETALIPTAKGKAAWHSILAERRLDEATKLAVAGDLDTKTQHFLTANFSTHVADAVAGADQLEQHGDVTDSLDVRSDLDARLSAHEDILAQVVNHLASDGMQTETDTSAQTMLAVVSDTQDSVEDSRLALEDSINASASATLAANVAADADTTSSSTEVAVNDAVAAKTFFAPTTPSPMGGAVSAAATTDVQTANNARTMEVTSILAKYAPLLATLPNATTTATSTATSTDDLSDPNDSTQDDTSADGNSVKPSAGLQHRSGDK